MECTDFLKIFIAGLFTVAKGWKHPTCPSSDDWMDKMWHSHIVECYLAIKRNKVLTHAATWMNLEKTMPGTKDSILHNSMRLGGDNGK